MLNEREKHKMETIIKMVKKEITIKEAMYSLNLSRQQIYRLTKIYKTEGEDGFIHKNRGKVPANKINEAIIEEIKHLYLNEYYDYNFEAFYDELKDKKNTKVNTIFHIRLCTIGSLMMILFLHFLTKEQLDCITKK